MNPYGTRRASSNAFAQESASDPSLSTLGTSASQLSSQSLGLSTSPSSTRQRRPSSTTRPRRPSNNMLSTSPALSSAGIVTSSSVPNPGHRKRSQSIGDDGEIKNATKKDKRDYFECEKCSKVYRHSTCLVKHRWEHTQHWKEASKLLLSKHQQVQLLEAAAILQVVGAGSSLPEDKSYWPAAVSPPQSGLLGSQSLNLSVLHSSPQLFASRSLQPEMSTPLEGQEGDDSEDEDDMMMTEEDQHRMTSSSGTEDLAENMFEMDIDEATSDDSSRARSVGQDSGYYGSSVKSNAPAAAPVPSPAQPVLGFFPTRISPASHDMLAPPSISSRPSQQQQ